MPAQTFFFGPFELRPLERRLWRDGREVAVGERAMDLLQAMAECGGGPTSKHELMAAVWGHRDVEESNLHVQVYKLRRHLGADVLLTVAGRGYRLGWPVRRADAGPPAPPRRLSVIVLPFVETGASPDQAYFADALADDVTNRLARLRGVFVVGTATAMTLRHGVHDLPAFARDLGVRHVLGARIERDGGAIELSARLSEAATGAVIWADTMRAGPGGARQLRHDLVDRLARALDLELLHAEVRRISGLSADEQQAADLVMRGRCVGGSNWSREHYEQALALFERAVALAPEDAEALSRRALMRVSLVISWPGADVDEQLAAVEADVERAIAIDSLDPLAHLVQSQLRQQQYRLDEAVAAVERSLELQPGDPYALSWQGEVLKLSGECERALAPLERALALSPRDPHRWVVQSRLGVALLLAGRSDAARPWLEQSCALHPHWGTVMMLAAALSNLGERDAAVALTRRSAPPQHTHSRFNRLSRHPVYLRQMREQVFAALVRCGLRPDMGFADEWQARQVAGR